MLIQKTRRGIMRAVIIGRNECMQRRSMDVCRKYACGAMAQNAVREAFSV